LGGSDVHYIRIILFIECMTFKQAIILTSQLSKFDVFLSVRLVIFNGNFLDKLFDAASSAGNLKAAIGIAIREKKKV